jgi:hypothetical protein
MGTNALGPTEPGWIVDTGSVRESHHRPYTWCCHQAAADGISPDEIQEHFVELGELCSQRRASFQQRNDNGCDEGLASYELPHTCLEANGSDCANLQPKVAQLSAQIALYVVNLALKELARGQKQAPLLACWRLHMDWLEQTDPHHLCDAECIITISLVDPS